MRNMKRWLAVLMSATVAFGGAGVTQLSTVAAYAEGTDNVEEPATTTETKEQTTSHAADYSTLTNKNGTFKTHRTFGNDGLITAVAYDETVYGTGEKKPALPTDKFYYDLKDAKLVTKEGKAFPTTYTKTAFSNTFEKLIADGEQDLAELGMLQLVKPSYVEGYNSGDANNKIIVNTLNSRDIKVKMSKYDEKSEADQTITLTVEITPAKDFTSEGGVINGDSAVGAEIINKGEITVAITVKGQAKDANSAEFYLDNVSDESPKLNGGSYLEGIYDGTSHKVVADTITGWTVSYEVYNKNTAKYEAVNEVTITDVPEEPIKVRATYKKSGENDVVKSFEVNLKSLLGEKIEDEDEVSYPIVCGFEKSYYSISGDKYNAADFLTVKPRLIGSAYWRKEDNTVKKAFAANEAQIKAFINEFFEIVETPDEKNPDKIKLEIIHRNLNDKEWKALAEKYAQMLRNVNYDKNDPMGRYDIFQTMGIDWIDDEVRYDHDLTYLYLNSEPITVYIDNATAVEGTMPELKYVVKKYDEDISKWVEYKGFDTSLLEFTTIGGEKLNQLKPGTYKMVATAKGYAVEITSADDKNATYGVLTVTAKPAAKPAAKALKASKIKTVKLAKANFSKKALKKKKQTTTIKVTKTGNGKLTFAKATNTKKVKKIVISKAGKVTLKKGLKKGTYKFKVKVSMAKTKTYKAATKTVTLKIKVK